MTAKSDKLLILDLDETLIHATMFAAGRDADFKLGLAHGLKRPHVDKFLAACLQRFTVGIWTSATPEYAAEVVIHLFGDFSKLAFVWARNRCVRMENPQTSARYWLKDLRHVISLGYPPQSIIVVDDCRQSWEGHGDNVIRIAKFKGDPNDRELDAVLAFLERLAVVPDVRPVIRGAKRFA